MPESVFYVEGVRDLQRALRNMPKELSQELRKASQQIATKVAAEARGNAGTRLQRAAAQSIKAKRDRVPTVVAGGGARAAVSRPRGKASTKPTRAQLFFGAEFGADHNVMRRRPGSSGTYLGFNQFPTPPGTTGRFFYPAVRQRRWVNLWLDAVDDVLRDEWRNRERVG